MTFHVISYVKSSIKQIHGRSILTFALWLDIALQERHINANEVEPLVKCPFQA